MAIRAAGDRELAGRRAERALRQAGLVPGQVVGQASTTIQAGIVISTTPGRGRGLAGQASRSRWSSSSGQAGAQLRRPAEGGGRAVGGGQRRLAQRGHGRQEQPARGHRRAAVGALGGCVHPAPGHHDRDLQRPADRSGVPERAAASRCSQAEQTLYQAGFQVRGGPGRARSTRCSDGEPERGRPHRAARSPSYVGLSPALRVSVR